MENENKKDIDVKEIEEGIDKNLNELNNLKLELEKKEQELEVAKKTPKIKELFIANGGQVNAFEDVLDLNPNLLNSNDLSTDFKAIKKEKPYFFNSTITKKETNISGEITKDYSQVSKTNDKYYGTSLVKKQN